MFHYLDAKICRNRKVDLILCIGPLFFLQTETLRFYSSYTQEDLLPLAKKIAQLVVKAETYKLAVSDQAA